MKIGNLRKIFAISVFSAIAVVMMLLTTNVFAEGEAVARIGTQEYETLVDAIAAVPTDNTETTIVLLKDVENGAGFKAQAGQNFIIDFKGHTYDASAPTVGSTGTETNGCQLLKDSKVTLKNGTLTTTTAQILVQNYCDLTLENMDVHANNNFCQYILSNNFGSLVVKGNTNITAVEGNVAFDLWYGLNEQGLYDDGLTVKFDKTFTGAVKGKIEYGAQGRIKTTDWTDKVKLIIEAGNFDVTFVASSGANLGGINNANIVITGGTFKTEPSFGYLAEGYYPYQGENSVTVLPESMVTPKKNIIYLNVGESANLEYTLTCEETRDFVTTEKLNAETSRNVAEEIEEFGSFKDMIDEEAITLDGEKVTAVKAGAIVVGIGVGGGGEPVLIVVYDVKTPTTSTESEKAVNDILCNAILEAFESEEEVTELLGLTPEEMEAVGEAIMTGKTLTADVSIGKKAEPTKEEVAKIEAKAPEGSKIAAYYDISVTVKADGEEIAKIKDLGEKVELELVLTEEIAEAPTGFTRTYSIIRIHDGVAEVVATGLKATNGKLNFGADKFSTYAVAYSDTATEEAKEETKEEAKEEVKEETKEVATSNPKTGDNIVLIVIMLLISVLGLLCTLKIGKNKTNKR